MSANDPYEEGEDSMSQAPDDPASTDSEGTSEDDPVTRSLSELQTITEAMRFFGPIVLVLTIANFSILLWIIGQSTRWQYDQIENPLVNVVLTVATIATIGWFETLRKRGNAIFQELSDELQWHMGQQPSDASLPRERPFLEARVALRTFSAAYELPIIPGRYGTAVYAALSLAIAVGAVVAL